MADSSEPILRGVHTDAPHDSAARHVSGAAIYIDDLPEPPGLLHVHLAMSKKAHARIVRMDLTAVRASPGVVCVLTAADIPGDNDVSPVIKEDKLFADGVVTYVGQSLFAVAAETAAQARAAAAKAAVEYEILPHAVTIAQARAMGLTLEATQVMRRGEAEAGLAHAPNRLRAGFAIGGQDHFYLEGQVAMATPREGDMHIWSSTQHPSEVQHLVAHVLHLPHSAVTIEVRRMGGGFGGKETQPALFAAAVALVAAKTGRPAKCRPDRDEDMVMTGKRHDFEAEFDVGFEGDGTLTAVSMDLASRCGCTVDLSFAINDRAMFHVDNCYFLPTVKITSDRFRTHTVSNTAFRGFGGPQGMIAIERALDEVAFATGLDPLDVRIRNLYGGPGRDMTPYHQTVEDNVAPQLIDELEAACGYRARRAEIDAFNAGSPYLKRGLALTPVKFGISFTTTHLNQAGALLHLYADGSILINHGGTEMGQGLMVKVAQIVANAFQVDLACVKVTSTVTDKVPNTSATAASSGADLNGMAALNAAETIKARLVAFAAKKWNCAESDVAFTPQGVRAGKDLIAFGDFCRAAHIGRVSLSATGYYATPKIHYDRATHTGRPFYYFAYGAAATEVIVDTLTGEMKVLRADILHDAGQSLNPAIDLGQVEGGYIQGLGWLTTEELVFSSDGRLQTHAPSTYKIPTCGDRPAVMNVELWKGGRNVEETVHRSKAVGEPPLMLAISAFCAIGQAVAAVADGKLAPRLDAPATPERILMAVEDLKARARG